MSINFVVNCHFTKIALLGLTHFLGTVSANALNDLYFTEKTMSISEGGDCLFPC